MRNTRWQGVLLGVWLAGWGQLWAQNYHNDHLLDSLEQVARTQSGFNRMKTYVFLGRSIYLRGDLASLNKGLVYLLEAEALARQLKSDQGLVLSWLNIGILLDIRDKASKEAEQYLRRSLGLAAKNKMPDQCGIAYQVLASVYIKRQQYRRALLLADSCLELLTKPDVQLTFVPQALSNKADCYKRLQQPDSALVLYQKAFDYCLRPGGMSTIQIQILLPWIGLLNQRHQYTAAMQRIVQLESVLDTVFTLHYFDYYQQKALTLAGLGRYSEAHQAWLEANRIQGKLTNETTEKQINEFQVKFLTLEKEAQNQELRQRNQIQQLWLGIAGLGITLLAGVLGAGWWVFRQRQKTARQRQQLLEAENELVKARHEEETARAEQLDLRVRLLESEREREAAERAKEEAQLALQLAQAEARRSEAEREATAASYRLVERTTFLQDLLNRTENILHHPTATDTQVAVRQLSLHLKQNLDDERKNWEMLMLNFDKTHHRLVERLKEHPAQLTTTEIRLAILVHMGHSNAQLADLQNVSLEAVKKAKYRLKKKLALDDTEPLEAYLQQLQA